MNNERGPTPDDFLRVLKKLRVRPGLRGESINVRSPLWRIGLWYDRNRVPSSFYSTGLARDRAANGFCSTLAYGDNFGTTVADLVDEDVETRSRSRWRAESTWRLSERGIEKLMGQLRVVVPEIEARTKDYNESAAVLADAILEGQHVDWDALPKGTQRALVRIRDRFVANHETDAAQALTMTMLRARLRERGS